MPGYLVALLGREIHLRAQIELENVFARLVAQHSHQGIVDLDEAAFVRGEKDTFLHVVK